MSTCVDRIVECGYRDVEVLQQLYYKSVVDRNFGFYFKFNGLDFPPYLDAVRPNWQQVTMICIELIYS